MIEKNIEEYIKEYMKKTNRKELFFSEIFKINPKEEIEKLFANYVREFAKTGTRKNSNNRRILEYINIYEIISIMKKYGIFNRFYCYFNSNNELKFGYCACQDYISERGIVRELLVK